jgi:hypothetical protein
MFWTTDHAKRRRLARLLRTNPPLLNWCMRRYHRFLPLQDGGSDGHALPA